MESNGGILSGFRASSRHRIPRVVLPVIGVGAIVRHQVPTLVGVCAWLLFVEGLLASDVGGLGDVGRFLPGSAAAAISGQDPGTLLAPAIGLALLALYTVAATLAGSLAIFRRDVG